MNIDIAIKAMISMMPAAVFLVALVHLDTHKLLAHRFIVRVFAMGGVLALAAYGLNMVLMGWLGIPLVEYSRWAAPLLEESLKAAFMVWLFRREHVGFMVDAAIIGFTLGAGFSFVENLFYLFHAHDAHYAIWTLRGFGTALMHGGCAALFGVISQHLTDRHDKENPAWYLPGLLVAVFIHAVFNLAPISPVISAVATILIIPTLLFLLFEENDVSIHNFLEQDFERHRRLLEQIERGEASDCDMGRFLLDVERFFDSPVRDHMRRYLHVHTELVLSTEQLLLAREEGLDIAIEEDTKRKIEELHLLERHIGKSGMRTLLPHIQLSKHEFWFIHMIEEEAEHGLESWK